MRQAFRLSLLAPFAAMLLAPAARAAAVTATYHVPVRAELRPYADFPMRAGYRKGNDGTVTIGYSLPADIAGVGAPGITLTGPAPTADGEFFTVIDPALETTGECVQASGTITCMLHYAGIHFDAKGTAAYLQQKYANDPALPKRLEVMQAFSGDAVGILTIDP